MCADLGVKLLTQHYDVFEFVRDSLLVGFTVVPDARLPEKVKPGSLDDSGLRCRGLRSEEHRGSEDPFECRHQAAVLFTALLHAEGLQHLGRAPEPDCLALLPHRQRGEKNWHNPVLPKRNPEVGMTGDLQNEVTVSAFIDKLPRCQCPQGQPAEHEWSRTKAQVLVSLLPVASNQFDAFRL